MMTRQNPTSPARTRISRYLIALILVATVPLSSEPTSRAEVVRLSLADMMDSEVLTTGVAYPEIFPATLFREGLPADGIRAVRQPSMTLLLRTESQRILDTSFPDDLFQAVVAFHDVKMGQFQIVSQDPSGEVETFSTTRDKWRFAKSIVILESSKVLICGEQDSALGGREPAFEIWDRSTSQVNKVRVQEPNLFQNSVVLQLNYHPEDHRVTALMAVASENEPIGKFGSGIAQWRLVSFDPGTGAVFAARDFANDKRLLFFPPIGSHANLTIIVFPILTEDGHAYTLLALDEELQRIGSCELDVPVTRPTQVKLASDGGSIFAAYLSATDEPPAGFFAAQYTVDRSEGRDFSIRLKDMNHIAEEVPWWPTLRLKAQNGQLSGVYENIRSRSENGSVVRFRTNFK